jgi:hypothetical protein
MPICTGQKMHGGFSSSKSFFFISITAHPQNVQLLNVRLLNFQLPNVQLPKVLITQRPDYLTSSYQRSRLPNVHFT